MSESIALESSQYVPPPDRSREAEESGELEQGTLSKR